ncbi:MAG: alpha/beta fold hydrolase [Verrucomicrobiales bacterium]|nr:alpha/beta fold hydrolase [Verrucomicrobiales bacterium]
MTFSQSTFDSKVTNSRIHRISASPEGSQGGNRGIVVMLHGLGDHSGCHRRAMEIFCDLGYRVEGFDWPGHGKSYGNRGDIPGVKPAIKLINELIEQLDSKPVAVYAHSTGGFLALPFMSRFGLDLSLKWLWLSSPLIKPTHRQSKIKIWAAEFLADFVPELSIPTGVKPSNCYHVTSRNPKVLAEQFEGCHSKISARFGRDLMLWESEAAQSASQLDDPLKVLVTQGREDLICPPEYVEEIFQTIPATDKTLLLFDGIRHEPLREPDNTIFIKSVTDWLNTNSDPI